MWNIISKVQTTSYYPQQLVKSLRCASKISPALSAMKFVAKNKVLPYLNYIPGAHSIASSYNSIHNVTLSTLQKHSTFSRIIYNKNTVAALSALGTASTMLTYGAPVILVAGTSALAAGSAFHQQKRSEDLSTQETFLNQALHIISQEYPYADAPESTSKSQTNIPPLSALDYSKFALDMYFAYNSSIWGQAQLVFNPAMLFSEHKRVQTVEEKQQRLNQALSNYLLKIKSVYNV